MDPRIPTAARLQQQRNYSAAEQIYRQVLQTQPRNPDALLLLGLLLHDTGRNEPAVEMLKRAGVEQPNRPELHQGLVAALSTLGRLPEAIVHAREAVRLRPLGADAHHALAMMLFQHRDYTAALPPALRATEIQPRSAGYLLTLSRIFQGLEAQAEAMAALDRALSFDPKHADAMVDKAQLLQNAGRLDEAISLYEAGLRIAPNHVPALNNLGSCYLLKTRHGDAIRCFEAAAALWPKSPKPRNNIGAAFKEIGRIDDAIIQFQKAVEIDPAYADGYCNIGSAYASIAEHLPAIDAFRNALRIQPDFAAVGSNLLLTTLSPADLSPQQVFEEHRDWNRRHAEGLIGKLPAVMIDRSPDRRLKIGYVSPDFREHSVKYFIEGILAAHDRSQVQVHCYATGRRSDAVTGQLASLVDAWHPVANLNDRQLAEKIRNDQIDILVDLAGHTSDNRLLAFALKPAPVQVTYLGYPTTTGMSAIDFRLTDSICDPPGADAFYTEKLVRLPNAFFVYSDDRGKPFDPNLPADRNGYFTFGSFNSHTKMNDQTLQSWANILQAVPRSRLFMKARPIDNPSTRRKLLEFFTSRGITADRLDLRSWVTLPEHLALLGGGIDLMLDTFPYNGHTTTCQSLWMGAAVVTRAGDSFRSRVGKCILQHLDLPDLVADSQEQYEQIAISLANDWTRLRELRPTLRNRLANSPLCDAVGLTRNLESAYRRMASAECKARGAK
jgi:predicted O-linked N-acetylglucosamine transferase (SPINDLY family)